MKKYSIFCNRCGKEINGEYGRNGEDALSVEKIWGYFSRKDGEVHSFDLCETCYDELTAQFKIPVTVKKQRELL